MRNVVVIGTFMPVTRGHEYMLEFASSLASSEGGKLLVLLNSRAQEPIPGSERYSALIRRFPDATIRWYEGEVPQNPSESEKRGLSFWAFLGRNLD